MIENLWNKLAVQLPKALAYPACTCILNGQFVLLFGGFNEKDGYQDAIYIYSVREKIFKLSKIKCPERVRYQVIKVNDKNKDTLSTFGWIRCKWKEFGIDDHLFPPEYLIRVICGYYLNEFVHLFSHTGDQYKINAFDIIDC